MSTTAEEQKQPEKKEEEAVKKGEEQEVPPQFNTEHFPTGNPNTIFYNSTCEELSTKFGQVGVNEAGIFHNVEKRDIAKHLPAVVKAIVSELQEVVDASTTSAPPTIVEIGCGTGIITLELLKQTKSSKSATQIFATEVSTGFYEMCQQLPLVDEEDKKRTHFVLHGVNDLKPIPTHSCQLVLLCDVYHHFELPKTMMKEISRILIPNIGRVFFIDYVRDVKCVKSHTDDPDWVIKHVRGDQATFETEMTASGFKKIKEIQIEGIIENYFDVFEVCF